MKDQFELTLIRNYCKYIEDRLTERKILPDALYGLYVYLLGELEKEEQVRQAFIDYVELAKDFNLEIPTSDLERYEEIIRNERN